MKPILYNNIKAFDASLDYVFQYQWNGNQSFGSICLIKNNATNEVVYESTQTTMQLKYELPANTLTNGILYNVSIATVDNNMNVSEYSDPVIFYCFTTPTFIFSNLTQGQIVKNSTYEVSMMYYQSEQEPLQSYIIEVYDSSKNLIQSSATQYAVTDIKYTMSNLEDNKAYYILARAETLNGMQITTGFISFLVNYVQPSIYSIISLENIYQEGYIKLQSNVQSIDCSTKSDPIFIDGEYIDLRHDVLSMDKDFSLNDNYIINISGYGFSDGLIMQLSTVSNTISVYYRRGVYDVNNNIEKTYIELIVPVGFTNYVCYSNFITTPLATDKLSIWIVKKNGLYKVCLKDGE